MGGIGTSKYTEQLARARFGRERDSIFFRIITGKERVAYHLALKIPRTALEISTTRLLKE